VFKKQSGRKKRVKGDKSRAASEIRRDPTRQWLRIFIAVRLRILPWPNDTDAGGLI